MKLRVRIEDSLLVLLVVASVALQVWLLGAHWINPDEGAHLMDARLAMAGLVPDVDFGSRQPLYVYAYVPFLQLLGGGLFAGRVLPLVATLAAGGILSLIGHRLWGWRAGCTAAALYLCAPSIFMNSSVVKTEPLAILFVSLGIYGLVAHFQSRRWWPLVLAGVAFGCGYYVRESTLAGPLAAILVIMCQARDGVARTMRRLIALGCGMGAVCAVVLALYARFLSPEALFTNGQLFPLAKILGAVERMRSWTHVPTDVSVTTVIRYSVQTGTQTLANVVDALRLNAHFVAGVFVALAFWGSCAWGARRSRRAASADQWGLDVAFAWLGSFMAAYAYYTLARGFFQFYVREFIPPMALLLAYVLADLPRRCGWARGQTWLVPGGLAASLAVYGVVKLTSAHVLHLRMVMVFGLGIAALWMWGAIRRVSWERRLATAAVLFLGAASLATSAYAAKRLGVAYDSVWSPKTVAQVVTLIQAHSAPGDEVLSGGVIWELEARRRPFLTISHPLVFLDAMPEERARRILSGFAEHPPRIVVNDGYTERTYYRQLPELERLVADAYTLVGDVPGSRYTVQVYVRREDAP